MVYPNFFSKTTGRGNPGGRAGGAHITSLSSPKIIELLGKDTVDHDAALMTNHA